MRMKIYLAGPMLACKEDEMTGWRTRVKEALKDKYDFLDPVEIEADESNYIALVNGDLAAIKQCDIVLAFCWKASPGTSQELVYAHTIFKKITFVVNLINSPWLSYHAHSLFFDLDSCISVLKTMEGFGVVR